MTEPSLKFAGRLAFQSVKLILRVAFILIKVILAAFGGLFAAWAAAARTVPDGYSHEEPRDMWGRRVCDYDMAGNPFPGTGYAMVNRGTGEEVKW